MVINRKLLLNDSCDHRARPYAGGESIRHRAAVENAGEDLLLVIGQLRGTTRSVSFQDAVHAVCLPVVEPDRHLGAMNLQMPGNFRSGHPFHVERDRMESAGNAIGSFAHRVFAKLYQLLDFLECSTNSDRLHGISFFWMMPIYICRLNYARLYNM